MKNILFVSLLFCSLGFAEEKPTEMKATETKTEEKAEKKKVNKLSNESEVSLIQTGGNTNVETYNAKTLTKYEMEKSVFELSGHYTVAFFETTDDDGDTVKAESARNWDMKGKYERVISSRFNGFTALQYEGDEFSGFKQRENFDLGGKYLITKTDKKTTSAELGARYTIEKTLNRDENGDDVFNFSKARIYIEHAQTVSKALSFKLWIEYLPNFTRGEDYLVNYEPSVSFLFNSMFSLKTAYKVVYDNQPNIEGNERSDTIFTTSLLARF